MAEPMRYPDMAAAMPDGTGRDLLHELLGCRWGHVVSTPDDTTPCTDQAYGSSFSTTDPSPSTSSSASDTSGVWSKKQHPEQHQQGR